MIDVEESVTDAGSIDYIGGADVAFLKTPTDIPATDKNERNTDSGLFFAKGKRTPRSRKNEETSAVACVVVIEVKTGEVVEVSNVTAPVYFPYVPGFLSFREGPAVLKAIGELTRLPGVMIYDGCGIAHPRGLGLASHMSLLTGIPSVGCAKSRLCGTCGEPGALKGSWTEIIYRDTVVGVCLRTRDNVRPVYVSPGNLFDIHGAREIVDAFAVSFRLPEPTRLAHNYVTAYKKNITDSGVKGTAGHPEEGRMHQ